MSSDPLPQILAQARTASGLAFQVRKDPPGKLDVPEFDNVLVSIHLGAPAHISCRRGGKRFRGRAVHGKGGRVQCPSAPMYFADRCSKFLTCPVL